MAVTFNKPQGMKYTNMAIYIDAHLPEIKNPYEHPDIEAKIYEYIYHIVYALACKSGYFKNFDDYDAYACYAASELYISMRNKLQNAGKEIRGKVVIPIKSSLNFIKATMFPLKINYQRENFATILDPKIHENLEEMDTAIKESIQNQYRAPLIESYTNATNKIPQLIKKVISYTPFKNDLLMYHKLYVSILLTLLYDITIPNNYKKKIEQKQYSANISEDKIVHKMLLAYRENSNAEITWHLDPSYHNYIRLLVTKVKKELSKELAYYIHDDDLSDELLDNIMNTAYETYVDLGDEN